MEKQSLLNEETNVYDALQTADKQGHSQTYYVDVTGFFKREAER